MSIRIIADSACDIAEAPEGLTIIPLTVTIDGVDYRDGIDLTHLEFYEKLVETDGLPSTSQVNPAQFEKVFQEIADAGETAVVITLSSKLSGTYESALTAAENFPDSIFVVDSLNAAMGEAVLVKRALELMHAGLNAADIAKRLDEEKTSIRLVALLDTLEYLKRGGRISKGSAAFGEMLSIKPVIAVENGEVVVLGKARGSRKGNNLLREQIDKTTGIDFDRPYLLGYSGFSDKLLRKYAEDNSDLWEKETDEPPISMIGATIGTHVGPGAIGVAFFQH